VARGETKRKVEADPLVRRNTWRCNRLPSATPWMRC